jgi:hypothetical protein
MILLISASWVARITGTSHRCLTMNVLRKTRKKAPGLHPTSFVWLHRVDLK